MTKQLVDLSDDERSKIDILSRYWKLNYTDTIKKVIRDFNPDTDLSKLMKNDLL